MAFWERRPEFDAEDAAILAKRQATLDRCEVKMVGDFVRFPDGRMRRISHVWPLSEEYPQTTQTSEGGSFYLGDGYVSYSGGLFGAQRDDALTYSGLRMEADVWFFHHDWQVAGGAVYGKAQVRVWNCSEEARR